MPSPRNCFSGQDILSCAVLLVCCLTLSNVWAADSGQAVADGGKVEVIKIVADKAPDSSSLKSIIECVTRGCKTNDEKAIAIYNYLRFANYHLNYPNERGGISSLKLINVYGWSLCGGLHATQASLWDAMGWKYRFVGWTRPGHTTVEAFYDGNWHYLDTFLKFYTWRPDPKAPQGRTIASQDDIQKNPALVNDLFVKDSARGVYYMKDNRFELINDKANWRAPSFFVCGDTPDGVVLGVNNNRIAGSPTGWMGIKFSDPTYSTDVNLAAGESLTLTWDAEKGAQWWSGTKYVPRHSCGDKEYRNCPVIGPLLEPYRDEKVGRGYSNGTLRFAPSFADPAFLNGLESHSNVQWKQGKLVAADPSKPASVTVKFSSPYIFTLARGVVQGASKAEVSLDGGKSFTEVKLADFTKSVAGKYNALVRVSFEKELTELDLDITVQCNRCSLPYLSPGKNKISVTLKDPVQLGKNRLVVTYAYRTGYRNRSYEEVSERGAELGKGHYASWSKTPVVVQKTFSAKDLPATFEIDVPTPKNQHPVYPRMMFVRREVVSPTGKMLPLPADAVEAKVGPNEELKSLPNPFLVGIEPAPKRIIRPKVARKIELYPSHIVSQDGKAFSKHFLKWKGNKETFVHLIDGSLASLPASRDIASAKLMLPVIDTHSRSKVKVGVVALRAPFEQDKPYDFKNLGGTVGTTILSANKTGKPYDAPKTYAVDITRALKQIASEDQRYHGFAIRTIPDRGVDDGWIVRAELSNDQPFVVELEVYVDDKNKK